MQKLPELESLQDIARAIDVSKDSNKLLLLKFGATWCKPCKQIAPIAAQLVQQNDSAVTGYEVDVDVVVESLVQFNVSKLPTFLLIKQGNVVNTWSGSNPQDLEDRLYAEIDKM